MAGRRRYLVSYDISDDRRLRRVHECAKAFGYALQYSVFVCDLSAMERVELVAQLGSLIHHDVDRVAIIDLGESAGRGLECFEFLGVRPILPKPWGATIV